MAVMTKNTPRALERHSEALLEALHAYTGRHFFIRHSTFRPPL